MSLITWSKSLSVNVKEIDKEHKRLVFLLNTLHEAMSERRGRAIVGTVVRGLVKYADTHFQTEEKYFDQFDFPQAQEHKEEHAAFVKNVLHFKEEYDAGRKEITVEVLNFLSNWLRNHIQGTDQKYSKFFNDQGLF